MGAHLWIGGGSIDNPFLSSDSSIRSLNRARIITLPGIEADDLLGKTGFELLSSAAVQALISQRSAALGLDSSQASPQALEACFQQEETRPAAVEIAREYGRRLGCFLLMLVSGLPPNRQARPQWSEAHWAFWGGIEQVFVGGGLVSGEMGRLAIPAAQEVLREQGSLLRVRLSPYGGHLPLVGLARTCQITKGALLALDFGHTSVKRGAAWVRSGSLQSLHLLPELPTICEALDTPQGASPQAVARRWARFMGVIQESSKLAGQMGDFPAEVGASLACYLLDGHPAPDDQGCYGGFQVLAPHLDTFFQNEVLVRLGKEVPSFLMHDGTAAAAAYAGEVNTVVLMLGTAIGSGFPPGEDDCLPLAAGFDLRTSDLP